MNHLERIVAQTRRSVAARKAAVPQMEVEREGRERLKRGAARPFTEAISGPGISLIAEHKRRSPSAGLIREDLSLPDVVGAYERGGAAALSVLTEEANFGGSLDDLRHAREASSLPILRKEFIVEAYQLHEALAAGADAVLLIVAALDQSELRALHEQATQLALAVLVEAHDERELAAALAIDAPLVGVNSRDLRTLDVDTDRTFALRGRIPDGVTTVAESGFTRRAQLDELQGAGFDAVLIGEALMRAADIEAACRALVDSHTPA